jgi:site-specific DNA-cytosine methylase
LLATEIPGKHIQDDVLQHLDEKWDIMVAHPPCQYLSSAGLHWNRKTPDRQQKTTEAFNFFTELMNTDSIEKICIENPVGYMNTHYRKADQIIHPYEYGEAYFKRTCLWLKGLPTLRPTNIVTPLHHFVNCHRSPRVRSRTFCGIAEAMASQWNF